MLLNKLEDSHIAYAATNRVFYCSHVETRFDWARWSALPCCLGLEERESHCHHTWPWRQGTTHYHSFILPFSLSLLPGLAQLKVDHSCFLFFFYCRYLTLNSILMMLLRPSWSLVGSSTLSFGPFVETVSLERKECLERKVGYSWIACVTWWSRDCMGGEKNN